MTKAVLALVLCCVGALASTSLADVQATGPGECVPGDLSAADRAGIRQAYDVARRTVVSAEDGFRAYNPQQRWSTHFDGRGSSVEPDTGGWSWGLELVSYGFASEPRLVEQPVCASATDDRLIYAWDDTLDEWYVNDSRGLEHGYTVHRRPIRGGTGDFGELVLTLAVRGTLQPRVNTDGRGVSFLRRNGSVALTYAGLQVFDAYGQPLKASIERAGDLLRLLVDERGARYPLTIDPLAQQAYLKASNTDGTDRFGSSIAVSGDTVVVGAPGERSGATGVNGDQSDNGWPNTGAAYVFVRDGSTWQQQAYLKPFTFSPQLYFGTSVAISGDTVVVGAPEEHTVDPYSGAAYVFMRSGTTWTEQAFLKASNAYYSDWFGYSVAISGDTLVVGAPLENGADTGVNGNQLDRSAINAGAAYVFGRSGTSWSQEAYLKASNTEAMDWFGFSVAVSGDTVVVGAEGEDSNATGVNGNGSDNSAGAAGAAYVYQRSFTGWSHPTYLKASNTDPNDWFGTSVAISGDRVVVGAHFEDSNATGVDGDGSDNGQNDAGAAYVFQRDGNTWTPREYLKASNTPMCSHFGYSVAASGDLVVTGAPHERSQATGVNGDQFDEGTGFAGAVYVHSDWGPGIGYCFGDLGGGVPCPCANENDGSLPGAGCANGVFASGAQLAGAGSASILEDSLVLTAIHLEPTNYGLYFQADNDLGPGVAWGDGLRCAGGNLRRIEARLADAAGSSSTTVAIAAKVGNLAVGSTKYYQCYYRTTTNPPCGIGVYEFNTSNGYAVTWAP